jgi:hypothetical protein
MLGDVGEISRVKDMLVIHRAALWRDQ